MKLVAVAVRDSKVGSYGRPYFFQSLGEAVRSFEDLAREENNMIAKHPEDYTLFHVGSFEDDTGQLTPLESKVSLVCAVDVVNRSEEVGNARAHRAIRAQAMEG